MPRPIRYRANAPHRAAEFYAVAVDADYLRDRLAAIGGKDAELLEHSAHDGTARYRLRQGLDKSDLPAVAQQVLPGDLVIERTETWQRRGTGYEGTARVEIQGTPASVEGGMRLADEGRGCTFAVDAQVRVRLPFVGGKVEEMVAGQVQKLLAAETAFLLERLGG